MLLLSLLLSALGVAALETVGLEPRQRSKSSCALIAEAVEEAAEYGSDINILGTTAVDCLRSMPYDEELGQHFIKEFTKYIQFQSTLEALVDPPDTYASDAVDILGGLKKIEKTKYDSQYDFDTAISSLLSSAHDGHLSAQLCSIQPFFFSIDTQGLVSVSEDGKETPSLYFFEDLQAQEQGDSISAVTHINGEDAEDFLNSFALNLENQDPDARWNRLFASLAVGASDDPLAAPGRLTFQAMLWMEAESLEFDFKNGSSLELPITAYLRMGSFNSTGEALFERLCLPREEEEQDESGSGSSGNASEAGQDEEVPPPKEEGPYGYPEPIIRDPYNQMMGFEIDDDTMVMYITSFGGPKGIPANQSAVFAETATEIVDHATSTGRSKIVIDISANGGGNIIRGFDLFKLFFPDELPYSATRFRRHDAADVLAQAGEFVNQSSSLTWPLLYQGQVTPDQQSDFESVDDFLGDEEQLGVKVSSLFANLNYTAYASEEENPIRGYGETTAMLNKTMPFKAEDIIIVGDGNCVSTCTTFVNLMTNVGGVRSVAFGGRPRKEPMQIMGGVRGAQSVEFSGISGFISKSSTALDEADESDIPDELYDIANKTWPLALSDFPLALRGGNVNFRNAYQAGNDNKPLQFEYQAADCRLYYTFENVLQPHTSWEAASNAIWGDGECVEGSTGGQGSKKDRESSSGGDKGANDDEEGGDESAANELRIGASLLTSTVTLAILGLF